MTTEKKSSEILDELAGRIADGAPVDWDEMMDSHQELEESLRRLQLVESVALVHRTPLPGEDEISGMETAGGPPATKPAAPAPFARWGTFEIKQRLGVGGFGEVYRAYHPGLGKDVALKLLRPGTESDQRYIKRFKDEAQRHARVTHANVLTIYGVEEHGGRVGLYTELIEGQTLEERLRLSGRFNPEEAAAAGSKICAALAEVHRAGLVHRDVKTGNVMRRSKDGSYLLMDFSVACERRLWDQVLSGAPQAGTPLFVAPEVLRGEEADVRADIYSLGVVLYRMVSGSFPYEGKSQADLAAKHALGAMVPLLDNRPDLPPLFIKIVERALALDPEERYASAGDMARDLSAFLGEPLAGRERPSISRRTVLVAAAVGVVGISLVAWLSAPFLAPPPPLRVTAGWYRLNQGTEEPLHPGAIVYPGDRLFLELEGNTSMYAYVLNLDSSGDLLSIFPLDENGEQAPMQPGLVHRMPGVVSGETRYWKLGARKGTETFYVIASREPLDEVRRIFELTGSVERETSPHRGISGTVTGPGEPAEPADKEVAELLSRIDELSSTNPGVWLWKVNLENQGV